MIEEKPSPMLHRPLHPALFSKVLTVMEYRRFPLGPAAEAVRLIAIIIAVTAPNNSFFIVLLLLVMDVPGGNGSFPSVAGRSDGWYSDTRGRRGKE
jgi:hypothetical protein